MTSRAAPLTSATAIDGSRSTARSLRVTIVVNNTFEFDSRFLRSALSLAEDGHDVTVVALSGAGLPGHVTLAPRVHLVRLELAREISRSLDPLPARLRAWICRMIGLDPRAIVLPPDTPQGRDQFRHPLRRLLEIVANVRRIGPWTDLVVETAPDTEVFHCQTLVVLPVARTAAGRLRARLVYDVADYHSEAERVARMPWMVRELVRRRERGLIADAAGFLAVSDPVADLVAHRWGVERPAVVLNCPPAWRPDELEPPRSDRLRRAMGVEPGRPIVLFQGGFSIERGLEELVVAMDEPALSDLDVVAAFMGYGRLEAYLREAAGAAPGRIHLLPAVPPEELLEWTAGADISFVGQPPRTLNHRMNLPNKLFESIMAGVPVVVSVGNEQCRLVTAESLGVCSDMDDPRALANTIASVLRRSPSERAALRAHCRSVALARYTWDQNAGGLVDLYRRLGTRAV